MQSFARYLVGQGHEVTVVTELPNHPKGVVFEGWRGRWVDRRTEDGVRVIRLRVYCSPMKSFKRRLAFYGSYMAAASIAGALLAPRRWDAVFATSPPLPVLVPAWVAARLSRAPLVMDVRDIWPAVGVAVGEISRQWAVRLAEFMERFFYRAAAAVTCVTRSFMEHVRSLGADPEHVHYLPNGTVPALFSPDRTDASLRERLGLGDRFVVGFYGNHGVAQGLPAVLDAAERLADRDDIRFLFVGEGPVKEDLVEEVERRGLDNVVFHEQVPIEEVAAWINAADAMLVPLSDHPIFRQFVPSKLFDYMACGAPVLLSVDGEARGILEESGGGRYVPPEDPAALADAVRRLVADRDTLSAMGRAGREYVLERYTREEQGAKLERLLRELTGAAGDDRPAAVVGAGAESAP